MHHDAKDAGGWFYFPKGTMHTFRNAIDQPVKGLMLAVPSGMDAFFAEAGRELNGSTPRPPQPEEIGLMLETAPSTGSTTCHRPRSSDSDHEPAVGGPSP